MKRPTIKELFIRKYVIAKEERGTVTKMVVAVELPTKAVELIINTDQIESKLEYYKNAYDDNMKLKKQSRGIGSRRFVCIKTFRFIGVGRCYNKTKEKVCS